MELEFGNENKSENFDEELYQLFDCVTDSETVES